MSDSPSVLNGLPRTSSRRPTTERAPSRPSQEHLGTTTPAANGTVSRPSSDSRNRRPHSRSPSSTDSLASGADRRSIALPAPPAPIAAITTPIRSSSPPIVPIHSSRDRSSREQDSPPVLRAVSPSPSTGLRFGRSGSLNNNRQAAVRTLSLDHSPVIPEDAIPRKLKDVRNTELSAPEDSGNSSDVYSSSEPLSTSSTSSMTSSLMTSSYNDSSEISDYDYDPPVDLTAPSRAVDAQLAANLKNEPSTGTTPLNERLDFSIADSDDVILFDGTAVKAATFSKLIQHLTSQPLLVDLDDFLLTYRGFASPMELLLSLIERFRTSEPQDGKVVRLRTLGVIKAWIERYWQDFSSDSSVPDVAYQFFDYIAQYFPENVTVTQSVKAKLDKNLLQLGRHVVKAETQMEAPILPSDLNQPLIHFSPIEIARQITLYEWDLWSKIMSSELSKLNWTKAAKKDLAPNVVAMTDHFNELSSWVVTSICCEENFKERVKLYKKILDVADQLRRLGNFNGLMGICSGLMRTPVYNRLKKTTAVRVIIIAESKSNNQSVRSDKKYNQILDDIIQVCNHEGNFAALRSAIKTIDPPVIPYLGMYLTDLMFIDAGNKDTLNGLINFTKYRLTSELCKTVKQYQLKGYDNLQKVSALQMQLATLSQVLPLDDDDLYHVANYVDSLGEKDKPPRPPKLQAYLELIAQTTFAITADGALLESQSSWLFHEPDGPKNIVMDNRRGSVVAVSLVKLIERLTSPTNDSNALLPFLVTFREFTEPIDVFNLLQFRFDVPLPEDASASSIKYYKENLKAPVQARVISTLKSWIQHFWSDFVADAMLFTSLGTFIRGPISMVDPKLATGLEEVIAKNNSGEQQPIVLPSQTTISSITQLDVREVARQLTLDAYRQVLRPVNTASIIIDVSHTVETESVLDQHDLATVISMIQGKTGFEVKDRRKKFKSYSKSFVASEAVTWFVKSFNMTREGGEMWCKNLVQLGVIESSNSKRSPFKDDDQYFRFIPDASRSDVILNDRLQKIFSFDSHENVGSTRNLIFSHLANIEKFVTEEFMNAKRAGTQPENVLKAFIGVCKQLEEISNWHSLQAVIGALQNTLKAPENKEIWEKVLSDDRQAFVSLRKVFLSPEDLRTKIQSLKPPCIPCFDVYYDIVADLVKRYSSPVTEEGLIDYARMMNVGGALAEIALAQQTAYSFSVNPTILAYIQASFIK